MENGRSEKHELQNIENEQLKRNRWAAAVETFSPIWYAIVMNTGILSLQMHLLPYQFYGLTTLSTIMFVFSLVQIVLFTLIHLLRVFLYPRSALKQTISDPEVLCLWGCGPIALLTVTSQVALTGSEASWGGHNLSMVAYVMWWTATFLMVATACIIYIAYFEIFHQADFPLPTVIFIPVVGTVTDSLIGGFVTNYSVDLSARLAVPIIITSWLLLGFGLFAALSVYTIFLSYLFKKSYYVPAAKLPGLLLLTGPMGQCAASIQLLGTAARKNIGNYNSGTFLTPEAVPSVSNYSVVLSLMFLGFNIFWLVIALYGLIRGAVRRQLSFTMTWWSTIFPVATFSTTFLDLAESLDSPAFRTLMTGLFLILLIDYFICWGFTLREIYRGTILDGRQQLADMAKEEREKQMKERKEDPERRRSTTTTTTRREDKAEEDTERPTTKDDDDQDSNSEKPHSHSHGSDPDAHPDPDAFVQMWNQRSQRTF